MQVGIPLWSLELPRPRRFDYLHLGIRAGFKARQYARRNEIGMDQVAVISGDAIPCKKWVRTKVLVRTKTLVLMTPDQCLAFCYNYLRPCNLRSRSDLDTGLARR